MKTFIITMLVLLRIACTKQAIEQPPQPQCMQVSSMAWHYNFNHKLLYSHQSFHWPRVCGAELQPFINKPNDTLCEAAGYVVLTYTTAIPNRNQ